MFALLAYPRFRRLWLAGALSQIGDWLSFVALSVLALDRGGGPLALAVMLAVHTLPQALAMPFAGVVADRADRRAVLIAAALVQCALTVLMAIAAGAGAIAVVSALVLVRSAASAFVPPAEAAALRHTVPAEALERANALVAATWSVTFVLGMAAGGAIAALGPVPAIALDAATFVAAALALRGLPALPVAREGARPGLVRGLPGELGAALAGARRDRALWRAVFAKAPIAIAGGAGLVALNVIAARAVALGSGAVALGVLQAVRGAGTALGPMVLTGRARGPAIAAATALAAIALFPQVEGAPVALLGVALVWGMGSGANWVLSSAAIQRLAPDHHVGRLASIDELAVAIGMVAGAFVGAIAIGVADVGGAAMIGAGLGAIAWLGVRASAVAGAVARG